MEQQIKALRFVRDTPNRAHTFAVIVHRFGGAVAQSLLDQGLVERRRWQNEPSDWLDLTVRGAEALELYARLHQRKAE
jgi:hypothetical protein